MATQKDSKEYYDECLDKLETIKKGLTKIGKHQRDFLRLFIEQKEINKHEREYEWFEEEYGEEAASSDSGVKFGGNLGAGIQYPILSNIDLGFEVIWIYASFYLICWVKSSKRKSL